MSEPLVKLSIRDQSATVILNRADKRNALSRALLAELTQMFEDLHLEKRVKSVILTGAGTVFCAGMDLGEMHATAAGEDPHAQWQRDAEQYHDLLQLMLRFPKPIIAAVNGPAIAGGAGLVLACDLVVASQGAKFGLPEPKRGIVAGLVSPLLAFRVGGGMAGYLLLSAQTIDAARAQSMGLFHEVVPDDVVWVRAAELAKEIATCAPEALLLTKRMLNEIIGEHLSTLLAVGAATSATARTTESAAEGLKAFLEKREPKWP
jgi:methylglutaconyl-CoA hydratase